ncbi:NLRC3 [Symbiodinium sp. CCMP2456]|nr:NLRC3 [Symbiodinium sp. CCMP2456]
MGTCPCYSFVGGAWGAEGKETKEEDGVEYASDDAMDLAQFLISADIRLVRAEFLWSLCEAQASIPRRQEAEDESFETPQGKQTALVRHDEVSSWAAGRCPALICSISHCWEAREHSDPCGHQLQIICDCTRLYAAAYDAPVWLFLDQTSLFQFRRTPEQDKTFKLAMSHMHLLYCHEYTMTLRVHSISSDELWEQRVKEGHLVTVYHEESGAVRALPLKDLTRNQSEYLERGWCQAEYEWSGTRGQSARNQRIDVTDEEFAFVTLRCKVPMRPEEFRKRVSGLKFTHRSDAEPVYQLQEKVFMEKITKCKHLRLEFLDYDATAELVEILSCYTSLEKIALLNFKSTDSVLKELLGCLKLMLTNNTLEDLQMEVILEEPRTDEDLPDRLIQWQGYMILDAVAGTLAKNFSLKSFRFRYNSTPNAADLAHFAVSMRKNTTLVNVDVIRPFDELSIREEDRAALPRLLEDVDSSYSFRGVSLFEDFNHCDPWVGPVLMIRKVAEQNAARLSQSMQLEEQISTRRPIWPPVKCEALAKLLKEKSAVTRLFFNNANVDDMMAEALARALKQNKTVTEIGLMGNQIGHTGAEAFAGVLKENKTLRRLNLSRNQVGVTGAQALAEALKKNSTVKSIDLDRNQIGDAGAEALSEALMVNKTVTRIGLSENQITDAGAEAFAETFKMNETVTDICLVGNQIGDAGEQALTQALQENKYAYCQIEWFRYLTPSGPASWMLGRYSR